ncbi:unnamed protein product [Chironomus riparius]|uniref:Uncharacterized protein n=1 Tax=Chironomus riparius TaxID=315576 RepID=A0A9N9S6R4_9DIPT|nr:unnamed protein product [Chironomus riparius]
MKIPKVNRVFYFLNLKLGNQIFCSAYIALYVFVISFGLYELFEYYAFKYRPLNLAITLIIVAVLSTFIAICGIFLSGMKHNHIHKLLPYILKTIIFGSVLLIHGILDLSWKAILMSIIFFYTSLCSYSVYKRIEIDGQLDNFQINTNFQQLKETLDAPRVAVGMGNAGHHKANLLVYQE